MERISSSESVDTTFLTSFGGLRSLAMLLSTRPSVTSQLKKARRVLIWPCTVANDYGGIGVTVVSISLHETEDILAEQFCIYVI